jgi:hypothetical protein
MKIDLDDVEYEVEFSVEKESLPWYDGFDAYSYYTGNYVAVVDSVTLEGKEVDDACLLERIEAYLTERLNEEPDEDLVRGR